MTPETGQQVITTDILPNIWRSRDKKTMKFGQVIENNIRNIFLEKPYTKYGGKASSRPFYKKSKLRIFLDQYTELLNCYKVCFIACPSRGLAKYMNIKVLTTCFYHI